VWRISLLTNTNLVAVVALSLGVQFWSQHSAALGAFLKTTYLPVAGGMRLLAAGAIPLMVLEAVKVLRRSRLKGAGPA